jgi:DNA polymerase-3 subunit epsilon
MMQRPLVFLDIETTGGSPLGSRITEIGALRVEDGKVVAKFSQLVNPEQHVPSFITKLTGISDDMLWEARMCTARLSRRLYPDQRRHNLDTIIARHGFVVKDRHRAYDDAQVLFEFYQRALEEHGLEAYRAMEHVLIKSRLFTA